jgi:hypothetical protein
MLVRRVLVLVVRRKFVLGLLCVCLLAMRFSAWGRGKLPCHFRSVGFGFVLLWDSRSGISRPGVHRSPGSFKVAFRGVGPAGHDVGGCVASGCGGRSSRGRTYADRESIAAALLHQLECNRGSCPGCICSFAMVASPSIDTLFFTCVHGVEWRGARSVADGSPTHTPSHAPPRSVPVLGSVGRPDW